MDFVTIYRHDYTWPTPVDCTAKSPHEVQNQASKQPERECALESDCKCLSSGDWRKFPNEEHYDEREYDWSRIGPMGMLLEPKLYIAKSTFGDMPYSMVDKDRHMTTYREDYTQKASFRTPIMKNYQVERAIEPKKKSDDPCTMNRRDASFTKSFVNQSTSDRGNKGGDSSPATSGGNHSEYQDGISKTGTLILREKLHVPEKKKKKQIACNTGVIN